MIESWILLAALMSADGQAQRMHVREGMTLQACQARGRELIQEARREGLRPVVSCVPAQHPVYEL